MYTLQQVDQVGAASQQDMLAINHFVQSRMLVGGGPPAHKGFAI